VSLQLTELGTLNTSTASVFFMAAPILKGVRLYRMDLPDHPCPWGLRAVRLLQERQIPYEDHRLTSEQAVEAFKADHGVATTPQVFAGDERIGGYSDLAFRLGVKPESADVSYGPVVAVFLTAALMALTLEVGVGGFMGIAICLLAMLKLMDVDTFAASFRKYDLLSQRWGAWGLLYPGIELLVGLGILVQPQVAAASQLVGGVALLLGVMGMVSVGKAVFIDHLALNCACVGGNSKTPLGVVSFAENLLMAGMGSVMLFGLRMQ
jgi:glutaredoxin